MRSEAMKTKSKKDCRPTCCECGGTNVEDTAWIAYREDGSAYVVNGEGPLDGSEGSTWCHDCEEHHDLDYPDVGGGLESDAARYRQRQQNDAARERGPELLDALLEMIPMAHSHLLDRVKLMNDDEQERAALESDGLPTGWKLAEDYRKAKQLIELLTKGRP
jgi:hypothetical protein